MWNSKKMRKMKIEKKEYMAPVSSFVELDTLYMLALSKEDDEQMDSEDQLSNEYTGGSWENMWGNMQ